MRNRCCRLTSSENDIKGDSGNRIANTHIAKSDVLRARTDIDVLESKHSDIHAVPKLDHSWILSRRSSFVSREARSLI